MSLRNGASSSARRAPKTSLPRQSRGRAQPGEATATLAAGARTQARPADGIPAYLEASDERTRRIYLRHGYADYGSPIRLPDGPSMYPMTRGRALGRLSSKRAAGLEPPTSP